MKNFYDILATDINSTSLDIQRAYENLLQIFHPELNRNNKQFRQQFKEIQQAYDVLINPVKRRKYDEQLEQVESKLASTGHPKQQYYTKAIDITFTIVLIFFTFVFGDYVIKSINHSKIAKIKKAAVAKISALHLSKPHHKKAVYKYKNAGYKLKPNFAIPKPDTIKTTTFVKDILEDKVVTTAPSVNVEKVASSDKNTFTPKVSAIDNPSNQPDFLYETFLKANETGIVNLRETDHYNAAVIQVIPTGSNVFVLEKGNNYYKVKFENSIGYVPRWTIERK